MSNNRKVRLLMEEIRELIALPNCPLNSIIFLKMLQSETITVLRFNLNLVLRSEILVRQFCYLSILESNGSNLNEFIVLRSCCKGMNRIKICHVLLFKPDRHSLLLIEITIIFLQLLVIDCCILV